jgi:hypothetical protein
MLAGTARWWPSCSPKEPEKDFNLGCEQLRLLPGGEVATALGLVPVAKVSEPPLRVTAGGPLELVGEDAAACGDVHEVAVLERSPEPAGDIAEALPVEPGGGGASAGQPVEHEVGDVRVVAPIGVAA